MGTHVRERESCIREFVMVERANTPPVTDPVFDLIAEHVRLWRACYTAGPDDEVAASHREFAALANVIAAVPAGIPGLLAWLDHLESNMGFGGGMPNEAEFFAVLRTVRAFVEMRHA